MFPQQTHEQQITPLTAEAFADQGLAFVKYQQALLFNSPGLGVFNALTVLSLSSVFSNPIWARTLSTSIVYVPNVNARPVKMTGLEWGNLYSEALKVYYKACEIYLEKDEEVRASVRKMTERSTASLDDQEVLLDDQG